MKKTISKKNTIALIGAPFSGGQPKKGTELGPKLLRKTGINSREVYERTGNNLEDLGDLKTNQLTKENKITKTKNQEMVSGFCRTLENLVTPQIKEDKFCVTVGGDHSIAIGTISGVLKAKPTTGIIWVDAHADINTPESSASGNMHGMPVAYLIGLAKLPWLRPCLDPSKIVYIGLRDIDSPEVDFLKKLKITNFSNRDVKKYGIDHLMEIALRIIDPLNNCPLYLSFDVDGLDPSVTPSTGTAVNEGLDITEGKYICERLRRTRRLLGMDLVEVNPQIGNDHEVELTLRFKISFVCRYNTPIL